MASDPRRNEHFQKGDLSVTKGSQKIYYEIFSALSSKRGSVIGRHGTLEFAVMYNILRKQPVQDYYLQQLERNAGIFPYGQEHTSAWVKVYYDAMREADIMAGGWYSPIARAELSLLDIHQIPVIPLRSLEPYYIDEPWLRALEGHRVTVVSSFADTMRKQLGRAEAVWGSRSSALLPISVQWSFVRSYYSPVLAGDKSCGWSVENWKDALDYLIREVLKTNAEVVLIGCGGLGMPLAAELKKRGLVCVVLGGAIQNLFGIKGKRWEGHSVIGGFWNDAWVSPSSDEIPAGASMIEGGCYWF
jgi:hypothetical protein